MLIIKYILYTHYDMNKCTPIVFDIKCLYPYTKYTRILLFRGDHYTSKTDIVRYYVLLNSSALKTFN